MHIRFNSAIAGHRFTYSPGDVCNWQDEAEAKRMVESGIADELSQEEAAKVAASSGRPVREHRPRNDMAKSRQQPLEKAIAS